MDFPRPTCASTCRTTSTTTRPPRTTCLRPRRTGCWRSWPHGMWCRTSGSVGGMGRLRSRRGCRGWRSLRSNPQPLPTAAASPPGTSPAPTATSLPPPEVTGTATEPIGTGPSESGLTAPGLTGSGLTEIGLTETGLTARVIGRTDRTPAPSGWIGWTNGGRTRLGRGVSPRPRAEGRRRRSRSRLRPGGRMQGQRPRVRLGGGLLSLRSGRGQALGCPRRRGTRSALLGAVEAKAPVPVPPKKCAGRWRSAGLPTAWRPGPPRAWISVAGLRRTCPGRILCESRWTSGGRPRPRRRELTALAGGCRRAQAAALLGRWSRVRST
mmetsp:Transcript_36941/g.96678  ORF Transcript_36941/g.96678 Transcript_36941/m.96678 type:complete len:324 (-) Transcript_36941:571-1542(-)